MELELERNLGTTDRVIRIIVALMLLALVFTEMLRGWWGAAALIIAISQIIEGSWGY